MKTTMPPLTAEVLSEIEAFCSARDMSDSTFGAKAANDPSLVFDLRKGRDLRWRTAVHLREFMAAHDGSAEAAE